MSDVLHSIETFVNIRELVETAGERYYDKTAYSYRVNPREDDKTEISFLKFRNDVRYLAMSLIEMGASGKHIALVGKFSYKWALVYFATMSIGSVIVPLDSDWTKEEIKDTILFADCNYLFIDEELSEKGEYIAESEILDFEPFYMSITEEDSMSILLVGGEALFKKNREKYFDARIRPDELSLLVFTSGTTGKGKGVMLSQTAIINDILNILPYIDYGERTVNLLPMHHTFGSTVMLLGHVAAGLEIYISSGQRFITKELKSEKPEHLVLVPLYLETFYRKIWAKLKEKRLDGKLKNLIKVSQNMLKLGIDSRRVMFASILDVFGGNIRTVVCGGAPLNPDVLHFFENIGITILNGYGITECAPVVSFNHSKNVVDLSVGKVLDIDKVKIKNMSTGGIGEISVKGQNVMLGYYKNEKATFDAFDSDGYFITGDYGKLDDDGILYITGRKKNLIILSNGKNVYPEEIEEAVQSFGGVLDVIVYEGQSKRGNMYNTIVAEIYPDKEYFESIGVSDIKQYYDIKIEAYNQSVVSYKKVGLVRIRDTEFPKNTLRKIKRFELNTKVD